MSSYIEVMAIVEGKTEEIFINSLVQPYLADKSIFIRATQVSKPGQKGGDVRFARVKKDLGIHLKQRADTYVTLFIDYYGIRSDWPGLSSVKTNYTPARIAEVINRATKEKVVKLFARQHTEKRFIPYIAVHEFEALLFSAPKLLAAHLGIDVSMVEEVINTCGGPESINNNPQTAPSKRLDAWSRSGKFPKTTTGIAIARDIGIKKMREECPLFNGWLGALEKIHSNL